VRTLREAAELLRSANSIDALTALAAAIGCSTVAARLDREAQRNLGLDDLVTEARVVAGRGALRALLVVACEGLSFRDALTRIAGRLSTRAPHALWMVIALNPATSDIAFAAWTGERRPPRVAALVADRLRLVDSDAETLRALASAASDRDLLTHTRWVEVLGRRALTIRFYRALEGTVNTMAHSSAVGPSEARSEIALLDTSRLLFLSFLQAKGWLDGDRSFLSRHFDQCMTDGGRFHHRVLRPLFFGTLNTPVRQRAPAARAFGRIPFLNGGLFARTRTERRWRGLAFSDDAYGALIYDLFGRYRFTACEETTSWSEAAVDPEMLGRAFESLMVANERRRTGAFFTPFSLVERVANLGLEAALGDSAERVVGMTAADAGERQTAFARVRQLAVLDPACGSGAFLVHVLERVSALLVQLGDERDVAAIRREVLTRSIFGVDVNPTAVWLCQLRLWLSVVIESTEDDPAAVAPLPNLDRNIRSGDTLSGRAFGDVEIGRAGRPDLRGLRERYAAATGARKQTVSRQLERAERQRALSAIDHEMESVRGWRRDLVVAQRGRDLFGDRYRASRDERQTSDALKRRAAALRSARRRIAAGGALPFSFAVHFADVASRGGFNLIVGNPPWVRLHRVAPVDRVAFRRDYEVARAAAWEPGAIGAGAGAGFAAQVDAAALFVERSLQLLQPAGALALLLPVKLWRSLAGGGVRRFVEMQSELRRVEDHSDAPAAFDAAVYPSLILAERKHAPSIGQQRIHVAVHHGGGQLYEWNATRATLAFDASAGAPWILLPPDARRAFDRVRVAGVPLAQTAIGRPHLGVKCGCNDAFVVKLVDADDDLAEVETFDGRRLTIERALTRPLLRGEQLRRWRVPATCESIIWTHEPVGAALASLPPHAARWFSRWRRELVARTDARHRSRWWSLFRTESARSDQPRVIWGDVGREPRASVLDVGDPVVPLNSCYVARCDDACDAHALAALLNGPLARAWLNALAEPARGGYRRYFGWTLSLLPLPSDWQRARGILAPISEAARQGHAPSENELLDASLDAYQLRRADVAPLIAWLSE
jgi:hypothetical protein